jgi:crooked neck
VKFAELEQSLAELGRARGIFELAIQQPVLDMPEVLWKAYIDFEIVCGERELTRQLYERLLERTRHVKVGHAPVVRAPARAHSPRHGGSRASCTSAC